MNLQKKNGKIKDARRSSVRFLLKAKAAVWPERSDPAESLLTVTENISSAGLYFQGNIPQELGSLVRFEVRLPSAFVGGPEGLLKGSGQVVRKQALENERTGFVASIERYEFRPLAKVDTQEDA